MRRTNQIKKTAKIITIALAVAAFAIGAGVAYRMIGSANSRNAETENVQAAGNTQDANQITATQDSGQTTAQGTTAQNTTEAVQTATDMASAVTEATQTQNNTEAAAQTATEAAQAATEAVQTTEAATEAPVVTEAATEAAAEAVAEAPAAEPEAAAEPAAEAAPEPATEAATEAAPAADSYMAAAQADASAYSSYINQVYALINQERAAAGAPAVALDSTLTVMANYRAYEDAANNWFETSGGHHLRPDGRVASTIVSDFGLYGSFGEVLGRYQTSPSEIVQGWHNSSAHYACMISTTYSRVGVGVAQDSSGNLYWAAIFMD